MSKDVSYHQSAVQYNEEFATFAADLAERVENEEVKKWCQGIAKQHEFHADRHKKALAKLEGTSGEETPDDPTDTPPPADPAPASPPVESSPNPEQAAEPVDAGVGTPELNVADVPRDELDFRSAGEVVGEQRQEQTA